MEDLVYAVSQIYREKDVEVRLSSVNDKFFRGEGQDLEEMAGNLLDNACKWCNGRVSITVRPSRASQGQSGGMQLTVDDDGPGIPEEAAEALLERGTRLDEATPGHGIGLAIVRDIAKSYGGALTIGRSALGGARITVDIPPASDRR